MFREGYTHPMNNNNNSQLLVGLQIFVRISAEHFSVHFFFFFFLKKRTSLRENQQQSCAVDDIRSGVDASLICGKCCDQIHILIYFYFIKFWFPDFILQMKREQQQKPGNLYNILARTHTHLLHCQHVFAYTINLVYARLFDCLCVCVLRQNMLWFFVGNFVH